MQTVELTSFDIVGISVRTSNAQGEAMNDIPKLWEKFMVEQIVNKIPNKLNNDIYAVYTEYEGDHMKPYTMVLGCRVNNLDTIPEGMVSTTIHTGNYSQFNPKGNLKEDLVYNEWLKIWKSDLDRAYQTDFEIYGEKSSNPENAEVDIFIGINN